MPAETDAMLPVAYRVIANRLETHDTFTLELQPAEARPSFAFSPGQFNMLYAFGTGESAISISGDPTDDDVLVHTIRKVGVVTTALAALKAGDHVGVRGPFGSAWPMEKAAGCDLIFMAGGIGLAPLRPAIYHALANREHYKRVIILTGTRTPDDILFSPELKAWKRLPGVDAKVTVDHANGDWAGNVGVVTSLVPRVKFDPDNSIAMICGPEIMMRYAIVELQKHGLTSEQIYLTMERNMKCAVGFCGHCQFGPEFICRDGPVFRHDHIQFWFSKREL